jgi:mRNA interferase MazF
MNRGEVWWVDFGPATGGEIQKRRPAIIISNDAANRFLNRVQVVPLTSKTQRLYPSEAYVEIQSRRRKAMADQIATVAKERLSKRMGRLSASDMSLVEQALRIQLALV